MKNNNNKYITIITVFAIVAIVAMTVAAVSVISRNKNVEPVSEQTSIVLQTEASSEPPVVTTTKVTTEQHTQPPVTQADRNINLTSSLQYNVNIYLSNFSEVGMRSFMGTPTYAELAKFGLMYNFINRYERTVEYGDYSYVADWANHRVKESYAIESIKKFLGITVQPGFANGVDFYSDGYFYTQFTGAPMTQGFTIVSDLTDEGQGIYKAEFSIYDCGGEDSKYYSYSASQIENANSRILAKAGYGTACFRSRNINDRTTYYLTEYIVTRY